MMSCISSGETASDFVTTIKNGIFNAKQTPRCSRVTFPMPSAADITVKLEINIVSQKLYVNS